MRFRIKTEVTIPAVGKLMHYHEQEFKEDSNVFERICEYHEYIRKMFPECKFKCIDAKQV